MKILTEYTMEQWGKDNNFSAQAGQAVAKEIYEQMYECLPPLRLADSAFNRDMGVVSGFRVGEPYTHMESPSDGNVTAFCAAFGKCDDGRYYFLGYQNKHGERYDTATGKVIENK